MSVKSEKTLNLEFKIHGIELLEKTFRTPNMDEEKLPDTQFELSISLSIDKFNKRIINILNVKVKAANDHSIVATITVLCSFDITNFDEVVIFSGKSITMPDPIIETLNIITIGTVRGIMFNEFKGTWLHNHLLPVMDPKSFKQATE
jgi:hypothetical protein